MFACASIDQAMSVDSDVLPVWYSKELRYVCKGHCLYNMCYSLRPGDVVYVIIGDSRYRCSRHVRTFSKYCKEYDKNVKYRKFDRKDFLWKTYGDYIKNIDDWIVPFDIRLIDKCTRNCCHYGYGDGIRVYHLDERSRKDIEMLKKKMDQQSMNWKYRKHCVKMYGSENFLDDLK